MPNLDDPHGLSDHRNRCCTHAGALALAALMSGEDTPDCPHHAATEPGVDSTPPRLTPCRRSHERLSECLRPDPSAREAQHLHTWPSTGCDRTIARSGDARLGYSQ